LTRRPTLTGREVAIACARICDDFKAEDILVLDIRKLTQIADFFVLCSGASERQLKAIAEEIRHKLKASGVPKLGIEGEPSSGWVLLDYYEVVVHIFGREARSFYALEMLWGDAPRVRWQPRAGASKI